MIFVMNNMHNKKCFNHTEYLQVVAHLVPLWLLLSPKDFNNFLSHVTILLYYKFLINFLHSLTILEFIVIEIIELSL